MTIVGQKLTFLLLILVERFGSLEVCCHFSWDPTKLSFPSGGRGRGTSRNTETTKIQLPVFFPCSEAHSIIDDTRLSTFSEPIQSFGATRASTPTNSLLVFTPVNKAVPAAAESGTFLLTEYVCK